jgi:hypothetical protein
MRLTHPVISLARSNCVALGVKRTLASVGDATDVMVKS